MQSDAEVQAATAFDARGPLSEIQKALEELGERVDNLGGSDGSEIIQKASEASIPIPTTAELANMDWNEVHSLAGRVWRGE